MSKKIVIALGGNALGDTALEQLKLVEETAKPIVDLIEEGVLDGKNSYRHTFIFSHTNIFLPQNMQFASTFPREETYFLLKQFDEWNASIVFCGHVHKWDERVFNGVSFITLDSMSERNSPEAGDYLVRVTVNEDGKLDIEKVHMNYVAKSNSDSDSNP